MGLRTSAGTDRENPPKAAQTASRTRSAHALVELEDGIDGLLHINDISWTSRVVHPSEVVKKGDVIDVQILSVDKVTKRIAVGLKQLQ